VGSARALERLTQQHDAYRWTVGVILVNYHSPVGLWGWACRISSHGGLRIRGCSMDRRLRSLPSHPLHRQRCDLHLGTLLGRPSPRGNVLRPADTRRYEVGWPECLRGYTSCSPLPRFLSSM
jgi:hypothetical protein